MRRLMWSPRRERSRGGNRVTWPIRREAKRGEKWERQLDIDIRTPPVDHHPFFFNSFIHLVTSWWLHFYYYDLGCLLTLLVILINQSHNFLIEHLQRYRLQLLVEFIPTHLVLVLLIHSFSCLSCILDLLGITKLVKTLFVISIRSTNTR